MSDGWGQPPAPGGQGGWGQPPAAGGQGGWGQPPAANGYPPAGGPGAPAPHAMQPMGGAGMWRCPYCGSTAAPLVQEKISPAGWVVFAVLVAVCVFLCWIGLLMKETEQRCLQCGNRVG